MNEQTPRGTLERLDDEAFMGVVTRIVPAYKVGAEGDFPVAIIKHRYKGRTVKARLPLKDYEAEKDDQVMVTPIRQRVGKGFSITSEIEKI